MSTLQWQADDPGNKDDGKKYAIGTDPVSTDELAAGWQQFLEILKKNDRNREHRALNQSVEIDERLTITLMLGNSFQLKVVEDIQQEVLSYLRERFNNRSINLTAEVMKTEGKQLIYTNTEKFEYLAGKFPQLRKLKERLDLDTDF